MEFLPAIKGNAGCICCGGTENHLPLETVLYNGFGGWSITKDGEQYYSGDYNLEFDDYKRLAEIEFDAALEPDCDWRANFFMPLRDGSYQRQNGKWTLVEQGEGFA